METYSATEIIKILKEKQISTFSLTDFGRLFSIKNRQTLYKKIQRLEQKKIIQKLVKGKYRFLLGLANDFQIANFLYQPSYISLETALSFYGIITGFTYQIISITTKKTRIFNLDNKEFRFSQIAANLFWGFEKKESFLMAEKEKALLDYLYFGLKGLRNLDWDEMETKEINRPKLLAYAKKFHNRKLLSIVKELKK